MKNIKLICKITQSYLPTAYPAHYYGAQNNKVYVIYALPYKTPTTCRPGLEFVIARMEGLSYDYTHKTFVDPEINEQERPPLFIVNIDKPHQKFRIIETVRRPENYGEAEAVLNNYITKKLRKFKVKSHKTTDE